jgi:hypothetical protein
MARHGQEVAQRVRALKPQLAPQERPRDSPAVGILYGPMPGHRRRRIRRPHAFESLQSWLGNRSAGLRARRLIVTTWWSYRNQPKP